MSNGAAAPQSLDDLAVNKRFWLGQGRKIMESRVTKIEDAAGKLTTAIGWFWTAYTAAAVVGVALADRQLDDLVIGVIAAPSILLIIAYLFATRALMPVYTTFYVNLPEDIRAELETAYKKKRDRLTLAQWLTAIAALAVVAAVAATATAEPKASRFFVADFAPGQSLVVVNGQFEPQTPVTVEVVPGEEPVDAQSETDMFRSDASGVLEGDVGPLTGAAKTWIVTASWTEDDVGHTTTLTVSPAG